MYIYKRNATLCAFVVTEMLQSHMSHDQKEAVHARQIKALRLLFLLLPPENYQLLHDLLILLHRVASHQKQNLMSAINLGTMFAPHILCPRKVGLTLVIIKKIKIYKFLGILV